MSGTTNHNDIADRLRAFVADQIGEVAHDPFTGFDYGLLVGLVRFTQSEPGERERRKAEALERLASHVDPELAEKVVTFADNLI